MKGLVIARDFFDSWGHPFLKSHFPEVVTRIAAGRILGSDVLGGDGEASRDHDWGPQFDLFLSSSDFASHGEQLSQAMNSAAPNPWKGYRLAGAGNKSVRVESVAGWFGKHLQLRQVPAAADDWPPSPFESTLYFVRHGEVWVDTTGELSSWRTTLQEYPEERLYTRLAEECFRVWHYGEYNFAVTRLRFPSVWASLRRE